MKKLLFLFFTLTISSYTYSQIPSGLELSDIISVNPYYDGGGLTVPEGKVWYIRLFNNSNSRGYKFYPPKADPSSENSGIILSVGNIYEEEQKLPLLHPAGTIIDYLYADTSAFYVYEFTLTVNSSDTHLGLEEQSNDIKLDNKMQLFPNPTNSRLSLNSEKDYNIEVFDLTGRKIMEAQGNNLDMSNLSKATYIVKALDKESKETYSYKVIKN